MCGTGTLVDQIEPPRTPSILRWIDPTYRGFALVIVLIAIATGGPAWGGFLPGERVLLDAHNCYPEQGRWADRLERALGTGVPVAIEQDLVWVMDEATGEARSIVSHGKPFTGEEPSLEDYFFEAIRGTVEAALESDDRCDWPLVTLNLDIKDNVIEHTRVVWETLQQYEDWLTWAVKTEDVSDVQPLKVGPVLVLSKGNGSEFEAFYEDVPVGGKLLVFGVGRTGADGMAAPEEILPERADNFRRWWNSAWSAVEEGGQRRAEEWTAADRRRLESLVSHAQGLGYWVRFYTLDGYEGRNAMGWLIQYNFGSTVAVAERWRAAIETGVDFVASDQYEDFGNILAEER